MSHISLNPAKELVSPSELEKIIQKALYPKPIWMLNNSVSDEIWLLSKVGFNPTYNKENNCGYEKMSFKRLVSPGEYLTDKNWKPLLEDIRSSLLYLNVTGKISRPARIRSILVTATSLLLHVNELRRANHSPTARTLEQIKFSELVDYLLSFQVNRNTFSKIESVIIDKWNSTQDIDWPQLKIESGLTTREFKSLRRKLTLHLKSNFQNLKFTRESLQKYPNANYNTFDINVDLAPKGKTISNTISQLEALYTSRPAQTYKFQHSPMKLFSSGQTIFDRMLEAQKTPLIPANVSLHALSSALRFARLYGQPLRQYLSELGKKEKSRIQELGIAPSTSRRYLTSIRCYTFNNTKIPTPLKDLNITSWTGEENGGKVSNSSISVCTAITLYTAAIWILLSSFTAGRTTSMLTLRRNCFTQSPIDGLFDIVLRIPKSSEVLELEETHRPIPDLIYDYGLEFARLVCEIEDRRNLNTKDQEAFLFSGILSERSIAAYRYDDSNVHLYPLSDDTIKRAIDTFQDWSNSPLINGKRWYPSTHQFRRLFAVLYFNFSNQSGLEELSWFMGHSNLDQTFHYAEVSPTDEWIEEAELTIARIGAKLNSHINGDDTVKKIINTARQKSQISTILEPLVQDMISEHKAKTGDTVRFHRINGENVFFYFSKTEE
ncbi:hypothetical protein [Ketobacter sp.]|uniref:hypothetical protein n=1 Tax=Ketobacter sp. TaxID=2083498 RepID=UPI000F1FF597|nr:hypothetical protein [Ketobacter sp.]RLU01651.1 MAG: hypothetical protein D9N14_02480 [Ketobacter sp.]